MSRLLTLAALVLSGCVRANVQSTPEPLITDRPDFTESTQTVHPGHLQVEGGYTWERAGEARVHSLGEVLVRVPLGNRTEARLGLNSYAIASEGEEQLSGLTDTELSVEAKLLEDGDFWGSATPDVSILLGTSLPTGASAFRENALQPSAKLLLGWELSERVELASNLNYTYAREQGERFNQLAGSLALGLALAEGTGGFLELFGFQPESPGSGVAFLNAGLTRLLGPDTQLDARVGVALSGGTRHFAGVGLSRRW